MRSETIAVPDNFGGDGRVAIVKAVVEDDFGDGSDGPFGDCLMGTISVAVRRWAAGRGVPSPFNLGDLQLALADAALRRELRRQGILSLDVVVLEYEVHGWGFDDDLNEEDDDE